MRERSTEFDRSSFRRRGPTSGSAPARNGHIQATGRDARGRKQHRYHPDWTAARTARSTTGWWSLRWRCRRSASACRRICGSRRSRANTCSRRWSRCWRRRSSGSATKSTRRANNSFGLTTLLDEHVQIKGSSMTFHFRAKSGIMQTIELEDAPLARIVKQVPRSAREDAVSVSGQRQADGSASTRRRSTRIFARLPGSRSRPRISGRGRQACLPPSPSASFPASTSDSAFKRNIVRRDRFRCREARKYAGRLPEVLHPSGGVRVRIAAGVTIAGARQGPRRRTSRAGSAYWLLKPRAAGQGRAWWCWAASRDEATSNDDVRNPQSLVA